MRSITSPQAAAHHRQTWAGFGCVLSLRSVADRGLLRRQQADEGIHRYGECRYQLAALHVVVGCRASRAFGADTVPGCYEDLDQADLLVLVGSNAAWCHPILFQRMIANKQKRARASS
jgi:hypothetical protein